MLPNKHPEQGHTDQVVLQAQAAGSAGTGIVAVRGEADGDDLRIVSLTLQGPGGQVIDVPTLRGGGARGGGGGGSAGVIDVDVVG